MKGREARDGRVFSAEQLAGANMRRVMQFTGLRTEWPPPLYSRGKCCWPGWSFRDGQGAKRRPVLLVRDFGDADLLVVPITKSSS